MYKDIMLQCVHYYRELLYFPILNLNLNVLIATNKGLHAVKLLQQNSLFLNCVVSANRLTYIAAINWL